MQLQELQSNWNKYGETDPLWSILTDPQKKDNKWSSSEFFGTGEAEIQELLALTTSLGLSIKEGAALDFGCGIGRLTQALGSHFNRVTGVDIAPSMIELAREHNRHGERCQYVLNESDNLRILPSDNFAFVYSNYVLQHMRPEYSLRYIHEFVRVLEPGGTLVFQLPCEVVAIQERIKAALPPTVRRGFRRLRSGIPLDAPLMETHAVPRVRVERILAVSGARLVHVRSNARHDERWHSLLYYVTK